MFNWKCMFVWLVTVTVGFPVLALIIICPWDQPHPDPQTQLRVSHNLLPQTHVIRKPHATKWYKSAIYQHHILLRNMLRYRSEKSWEAGLLRDSSPKNENSVINYSPSCCSKPVRPLFIFGTQIKIFLMESESSQTLHRQQEYLHDQGPET